MIRGKVHWSFCSRTFKRE